MAHIFFQQGKPFIWGLLKDYDNNYMDNLLKWEVNIRVSEISLVLASGCIGGMFRLYKKNRVLSVCGCIDMWSFSPTYTRV